MFTYGCRADAFGLPANPVLGTDKRRQAPPEALDYYDGNPTGSDREMIEVGPAVTGDPSVVEQLDRMLGEVLLKAVGGAFLTAGAVRPTLGALRLFDHARQDRADHAEGLAGVLTPHPPDDRRSRDRRSCPRSE